MRDQVSRPYKAAGKIIVLYILIFKLLDTKLEDKILHRMIESIPWLQSALNFFMNGIFIRVVREACPAFCISETAVQPRLATGRKKIAHLGRNATFSDE